MNLDKKQKCFFAATWFLGFGVISCGSDHGGKRGSGQNIEVNPRQVGEGDAVDNGQETSDQETAGQSANSNENNEDQVNVEQVFVKAGLRNYSQVNATMSRLTGVPLSNAAVSQVFNTQLTTALPTDNDIKAFLGSQQVAVFKLAVEYCDAMIKDANLSRAFFGGVTIAGAPSLVFSAQGKVAISDVFVSKFWGKGLESLPPYDQSVGMTSALVDDLLQGKDLNNAAVTPPVLTGTCAGILSAAPVTMY